MGNYSSNQNLLDKSDKKILCENNGGLESKLLTFSQQQAEQLQNHQKQSEFEMKNLKKKINMDDNDIKILLHTFDLFINQVLQEKLSKMDGTTTTTTAAAAATMDSTMTTTTMTTTKMDMLKQTSANRILPASSSSSSTQTIFDNLAQMLSTHLDDYLDNCKRCGIVMAPTYKSCQDYHHHHNVQTCENNADQLLLPPPPGSFCFDQLPQSNMIEQQQQQQQQQRRMSNSNKIFNQSNSNQMIENNKLNNMINMENNIRINLPEILDQQDEVTILRMLIKLLSNKVKKLSDENRFLLQQISTLNDINTELAEILQHKFGK